MTERSVTNALDRIEAMGIAHEEKRARYEGLLPALLNVRAELLKLGVEGISITYKNTMESDDLLDMIMGFKFIKEQENPVDTILSNLTPDDLASTNE